MQKEIWEPVAEWISQNLLQGYASPPTESIAEAVTKKISCPFCHNTYSSKPNLERHLTTHAGIRYRCTICPAHYSRKDSLRAHIKNVHSSTNELVQQAAAIYKTETMLPAIAEQQNSIEEIAEVIEPYTEATLSGASFKLNLCQPCATCPATLDPDNVETTLTCQACGMLYCRDSPCGTADFCNDCEEIHNATTEQLIDQAIEKGAAAKCQDCGDAFALPPKTTDIYPFCNDCEKKRNVIVEESLVHYWDAVTKADFIDIPAPEPEPIDIQQVMAETKRQLEEEPELEEVILESPKRLRRSARLNKD